MRRKRVLVFDDEVVVVSLLKDFLGSMGYDVMAFDEPRVCPIYGDTRETCGQPFLCADIVLTDFHMPHTTGFDILMAQKERNCRVDIRNKAIMTGGGIDSAVQGAIENAGIKLFRKPFDVAELYEWLVDCESRIDLSMPLGTPRRSKRVPVNLPTSFYFNTENTVYRGTVVNMSDEGLCLRSKVGPGVTDQRVSFVDPLPNGCETASLRWIKRFETAGFVSGLCCTGT